METLLTGMLSKLGDEGIEKIAASAGVDNALAKNILSQATPFLTSKMADNAKSESGRTALSEALKKHDSSVFDKIDDVVNPDVDTKGDKILGHILGDNLGGLTEALSSKNETKSDATSKILEMAAPLLLGQLGEKTKNSNLNTEGIFDLLMGEKKEVQKSGDSILLDLAEKFLDKDNDGSILDDVMNLAGGFLRKK